MKSSASRPAVSLVRVPTRSGSELLAGKKLDAPPPRQISRTYKQAQKARHKGTTPLPLDLGSTTTKPR